MDTLPVRCWPTKLLDRGNHDPSVSSTTSIIPQVSKNSTLAQKFLE